MGLHLSVMVLGGLLMGCTNEEDRPPLGGFGGQGGVETGPCDGDEQRECGLTLDQGDGIVTCYRGVQFCDDGMWSSCVEGEVTTEADRSSIEHQGLFRRFDTEALSTAPITTCSPSDACDPYCYEVAENGGTATFTPGGPITSNRLCNPSDTTPLTECSPMTTTTMKCAHDLCTTGAALTSGCDTCVTSVCLVKPACCTTAWDSTCVNEAYATCLNSPPPMGLCDFGVYSKTTLTTANNPSLGAGSTVGGLGNITIDTDAATAFPGKVLTPCNVWIKNANSSAVSVSGGIWSGGSVLLEAGSSTVWTTQMHMGRGLYINSSNTIAGKVTSSGNFDMTGGVPAASCTAPATWASNPFGSTSTNINGQGGTVINGSAYAAGTMGTDPSVNPPANKFASQGTTLVPPPTFSMPTAPASPASTSCAGTTSFGTTAGACTVGGTLPNQTLVINGGSCTLAPGNYGDVTLQNGAKLVLNGSGTTSGYTFKSINGSAATDGGIQVGTPGNTTNYTVTVCGRLSLGNYQNIIDSSQTAATVTAKTPLASPQRLVMYVLGTDTGAVPCTNFNCATSLGVDSRFSGVLSVPNGTFLSGNNNADTVSFNGAVWASAFNVGTKFNLTQISKSACEALSLPGTGLPVSMCPWTNTTTTTVPGIPDSETEPCRIASDCQINQRCRNVDTGTAGSGFTPCGHGKCATGAALNAATCSDPCVTRICAAYPSCCSTTWDTACVGHVATVCDADCAGGTGVGSCRDNLTIPNDTTCVGYDLAVDYPCVNNTIPVCNHGTTAFTGNVTVGYWAIADRQFAVTSPNNTLRDGTCIATAVTINPGQCQNITSCTPSMAAGSNYTLMVDPDATLSECGTLANSNRRMDNWSWREGSYTCATQPSYVEYEYVADCPDDSIAVWKNLSWVTTVPNGSEVRFYGKAGDTTAELTAGTYQLIGTAETMPTNTTICSLDPADMGSAACVGKIATALMLTKPHGQMLSVRLEVDDSGGVPTINKWEVSYTCEYDQ